MSAASNSEDRHMGGQSTNMLILLVVLRCNIIIFSSVFPESQGVEVHSSCFSSVFHFVFCLFLLRKFLSWQ